MRAAANIAAIAATLFAVLAAVVWVLSSETFVRAFDWTQDHPVVTGIVFCTLLATLMVAASTR